MSVKFKVKRLSLSEANISYIQDYKIRNEIADDSTALRMILKEHKEYKNHLFDLNYISESLKHGIISNVNEVISKTLLEELRRIRLGTNNTDRNTQILIELIQGWMLLSNIDGITSTDNHKPDFLTFVETVVSARISDKKQKKDEKLNSHK